MLALQLKSISCLLGGLDVLIRKGLTKTSSCGGGKSAMHIHEGRNAYSWLSRGIARKFWGVLGFRLWTYFYAFLGFYHRGRIHLVIWEVWTSKPPPKYAHVTIVTVIVYPVTELYGASTRMSHRVSPFCARPLMYYFVQNHALDLDMHRNSHI